MLGFKDVFWEEPRAINGSTYQTGPSILFDILEKGTKQCDELITFMAERANIEKIYSLSLQKLSEKFLNLQQDPRDDGSTLKPAFDGLIKETVSLANIHIKISDDLTYDAVRVLQMFNLEHKNMLSAQINLMKNNLDKLYFDKKNVELAKAEYNTAVEKNDRIVAEFIAANPKTNLQDVQNTIITKITDSNLSARDSIDLTEIELQAPLLQAKTDENLDPQPTLESFEINTQPEQLPQLLIKSSQSHTTPALIFGPLPCSHQEFSIILKSLKTDLSSHSIKYGLLGTLRGLVRGDELFVWWKRYLRYKNYSELDIMQICQSLIDQNYLRSMSKGSTFLSSSTSYYQWKKNALTFSTDFQSITAPETNALAYTALSSTYKTPLPIQATLNNTIPWLLGNQSGTGFFEKYEEKVKSADELLKSRIFKFEKNRAKLEQSLMSFFEMMEAWELNRISNMKSAIHQFNSINSEVVSKLLNIFDRQRLFEETIKPEKDIQFIAENFGIGKFWPSPMLYHPRGSLITDYQIFGVSLTDQLKISKKPEPLFIAKTTSAIVKISKIIPINEVFAAWESNFDLGKAHTLRSEINKKPRLTLKFLKQHSLRSIVNVLILYLMELPDCVCTTDLNEPIKALYSIRSDDFAKISKPLSSLLSSLYPANISTLQAIAKTAKSLSLFEENEEERSKLVSAISAKLGPILLRSKTGSIQFSHDQHPQRLFCDLVLNFEEILENLKSEAKVVPVQFNYDSYAYRVENVKQKNFKDSENYKENSLTSLNNLLGDFKNSLNIQENKTSSEGNPTSESADENGNVFSSFKNGINFISARFKIKSKDTLHEVSTDEQRDIDIKQANSKNSIDSDQNKNHDIDTPATVSSASQIQYKKISNYKLAENESLINHSTPIIGLGIHSNTKSLDMDHIYGKSSSDSLKNTDEKDSIDRLEGEADRILATIDDDDNNTESSITIEQAPPLDSEINVYAYPPFDSNTCVSTSFDPECQALITYLHFTTAKWNIKICNNPQKSPSGELPFIVDEIDICESGFKNSVKYLKRLGHDLDSNLSNKEAAVSLALQSVIRDNFSDVLNYEWFMMQDNYYGVIKPKMYGLFGYFSGIINLSRLRTRALQKINLRNWKAPYLPDKKNKAKYISFPWSLDKEHVEIDPVELAAKIFDESRNEVYSCAKKYLSILETHLDDRPFFMGNSVTTLDAVAYGYLSLIVNMNLNKPALKTLIVLKYPRLLNFVNRMNSTLYDDECQHNKNSSETNFKLLIETPKSQPIACFPPEPNSVLSFMQAIAKLMLPNVYNVLVTLKNMGKNILEILVGKRVIALFRSNNYMPNSRNTGTLRFLMGSAFFILGFISSNRIFRSNDENLSEGYDDLDDQFIDEEDLYDIEDTQDMLKALSLGSGINH
ncbi:hypothetical protein BB561_002002 [Smittium simulii]|uniref:Rho-GAP domain-containing protein n=1 Tax=Smittium simulii TaxID=133385 RepID=A0A2T9YS80_9FUNG|nr:hypothetical protein BB561_002002 [Smittium simulii]